MICMMYWSGHQTVRYAWKMLAPGCIRAEVCSCCCDNVTQAPIFVAHGHKVLQPSLAETWTNNLLELCSHVHVLLHPLTLHMHMSSYWGDATDNALPNLRLCIVHDSRADQQLSIHSICVSWYLGKAEFAPGYPNCWWADSLKLETYWMCDAKVRIMTDV